MIEKPLRQQKPNTSTFVMQQGIAQETERERRVIKRGKRKICNCQGRNISDSKLVTLIAFTGESGQKMKDNMEAWCVSHD